jgi:hypothetical protein
MDKREKSAPPSSRLRTEDSRAITERRKMPPREAFEDFGDFQKEIS